jgi:DNA-binding XRE family transcriptional regulator
VGDFQPNAKGASRFGAQPIRNVMIERRWNCAQLAKRIGVTKTHLYLAVYGKTPPSPILRKSLPPVLGRKITDLFTLESLAATFQQSSADAGARSWGHGRKPAPKPKRPRKASAP